MSVENVQSVPRSGTFFQNLQRVLRQNIREYGMFIALFVIMLMNLNRDTEPQKNKWLKLAGAVAGGSLLLVLVAALRGAEKNMTEMGTGDIGLIQNLGKVLFTDYVVPFEIASILFLSAMVGAVVIGKKE